MSNLITYKNHRIRTIHDKTLLADQISNLQDWQVLIISDWKMKILYLEYRMRFLAKRASHGMGHFLYAIKKLTNTVRKTWMLRKSQTFKVIEKFYL